MRELKIYFRVKNLCEDDDGNPCDGAMVMNLGEQKEDIDYNKVAGALNKEILLEWVGLKNFFTVDDIEIITPEEYEREYGGEGE